VRAVGSGGLGRDVNGVTGGSHFTHRSWLAGFARTSHKCDHCCHAHHRRIVGCNEHQEKYRKTSTRVSAMRRSGTSL
jgi:hypothetical protein